MIPRQSYFLFLVSFVLHTLASPTLQYCPHDQRDALMEFKHEFPLNDSNSSSNDASLTSWNKSNDCCFWKGVTCGAKSGEVISLNLSYIPLNNSLKPNSSLFKLQHLRNLILIDCDLYGEIPSSLGNLSRLTLLELQSNKLVGEFPASVGNLTQLRVLSLSYNNFNGSTPVSLANLTKLSILDISGNQFTGENILPILANLTRKTSFLSPYLFVICMDVLSKMINKAAEERRIGYHPKCKNVKITHLCFADDLMVFLDGTRRSIDEMIQIFDEFAACSGLKISTQKSTLFVAGITQARRDNILANLSFNTGELPVRYLGLPLLSKRMRAVDYEALIDRIRTRMSSWTARFLSYAGRLQLLQSVIQGIINFWMQAFRLPNQCINRLEGLCAAFLWSGPSLNTRKAKVAWVDICKPKKEGGLGFKSLKDANLVCCLKLIWSIVGNKESLWVRWINKALLRNNSIWSINENTSSGSWIWRKLLKYREVARGLLRVKVGDGTSISFWYDNWSSMGTLRHVVGLRGPIDIGISEHETLATVLQTHTRRRHRLESLEKIEDEIAKARLMRSEERDTTLWKSGENKYKTTFNSKTTWNLIRTITSPINWYNGVWFIHATPKYSFMVWLAVLNRLSTGDRTKVWTGHMNCVLCNNAEESRDHLFFLCRFSSRVWRYLIGRVLGNQYSTSWSVLLALIQGNNLDQLRTFITRYTFQTTIYNLWQERNRRRHGDQPLKVEQLVTKVDKQIRNRLSTLRRTGDQRYSQGLERWFETRPRWRQQTS